MTGPGISDFFLKNRVQFLAVWWRKTCKFLLGSRGIFTSLGCSLGVIVQVARTAKVCGAGTVAGLADPHRVLSQFLQDFSEFWTAGSCSDFCSACSCVVVTGDVARCLRAFLRCHTPIIFIVFSLFVSDGVDLTSSSCPVRVLSDSDTGPGLGSCSSSSSLSESSKPGRSSGALNFLHVRVFSATFP